MPFSAACRPAWIAGQVASLSAIAPALTAAVKRGAGPNSPSVTAEVSRVATQPAPIKRSACRPPVGTQTRCRPRTPRRISARVAAMAGPVMSRGTASLAPSGTRAARSSRDESGDSQVTRSTSSPLLLSGNQQGR